MIFLIFVLIGVVGLLYSIYLTHKSAGYNDGPIVLTIIFSLCTLISSTVWVLNYNERWNDQRYVESFIESQTFVEYKTILESYRNDKVVDLVPMSTNLADLFAEINRVNRIVKEHNASNANFWFDWNYPDWTAPELIKF